MSLIFSSSESLYIYVYIYARIYIYIDLQIAYFMHAHVGLSGHVSHNLLVCVGEVEGTFTVTVNQLPHLDIHRQCMYIYIYHHMTLMYTPYYFLLHIYRLYYGYIYYLQTVL